MCVVYFLDLSKHWLHIEHGLTSEFQITCKNVPYMKELAFSSILRIDRQWRQFTYL